MSFRLASVSKVEIWNFRNSSISVRLCWWTSRKSFCWRHISSCRIRRSSSARAAWSSSWPIFSQYSAIIICLCSSSKVLICALELFSPTCSIDHFLSLGVFRKLAVSTVRVSRDNKTNWLIDICFSQRFPCSIERDRQWRLTDGHTFRTAVIGMFSVCFGEQLAERSVVYVQVRWRCNVGEGTLGVAELVEDHVVGLITCEGEGDVVGVVAPLRGVAQVGLHGDQVVLLSVLLGVHQEGGVEEGEEGQVEVEREEGEVKERRSWMACGWKEDSRTSWAMRCMWHQGVTTKQRALCDVLTGCATCACRCSCHSCWCSLCHACCPHRSCWYSCWKRTVFVAIFCSCRCTLYTTRRWQWTALTVTEMITVILHQIHCETHATSK